MPSTLEALAIFAAAILLGRLVGYGVRRAGERGGGLFFEFLDLLGVFEPPTLWDWIWSRPHGEEGAIVVIRLKDGGTIEGQFAERSRVDFSPRRPRVFLEKAYGYDDDGQRIAFPDGAYVEGDEIAGVQFKA